MQQHPLHDVVITGVHNTRQAKVLEGHDSRSISLEAAHGAVADAGLNPIDIDGVVGPFGNDFIYQHRIGPVWRSLSPLGIPAVLEAAMAIACGLATTVLIATGEAGSHRQRSSTAPWTRPTNEFVAPFGMFTAAEFALMARRHMHLYGTTPESMAHVAAVIRNNGHVHPDAVFRDRGPFTVADVLELVGLSEKKGALIGALSRGMQQRLGLARVLIHDPQLLLLDEPASGLDPRARIEMMAVLQELQRMGKTIIISSHILSELQSLCNRCCIIERGKLIYSGPIKGAQMQLADVRAFWVKVNGPLAAARDLLAARPETASVESGEDRLKVVLTDPAGDPSYIPETLVNAGVRVMEFREDEIGLEEVFLRVTKGETQ